ncbi:MAG: cyclic nucleotide-binding domain-containing protein [Candidatus Lambdaproteobacteria bacterium]|nr:cyclic nucleotide-binding domain-containing protein [Candidatus Lambdaproteobacteria bacterium]
MKIPFINTDLRLTERVEAVLGALNDGTPAGPGSEDPLGLVALTDPESTLEYINYELPPLLFINFSDAHLDSFELLARMVADPWLNNGGVIAFYDGGETRKRIEDVPKTNILFSVAADELEHVLPKLLRVIRGNEHILFQRAMQQELVADLSGAFALDLDVVIVSVYAKLIANYLYNMGFLELGAKTQVGLCLTEMLINAIEHGSCGITSEQKRQHLAKGLPMQALIDERRRCAAIAKRRVVFSYNIRPAASEYVIRDEGQGFDWRPLLDRTREMDFLAEQGRGIWLTLHNVERIAYNDRGNEVTLRIKHRVNASGFVPAAFSGSDFLQCSPGDVVFRQGEESNFLYYVAEGEYRVEINGVPVAKVTPADILVGEMSFLLQDRRSATVIANTPGRLIKISKQTFINSLKNQPYYGLFLAKLLARRLNRASTRIGD